MSAEKKAALRKTLLERRDAMSHDLAAIAGARIAAHVRGMREFAGARCVACYSADGSEVPTSEIMLEARAAGKAVCLPRARGGSLEFARVDGPADLAAGSYGIAEPAPRCEPCDAIDVALVPCVGASLGGARLGRGRGYYDRFLSGFAGTSVALAFSRQIVRSLPEEAHDERVDWVVTEDRAVRARR